MYYTAYFKIQFLVTRADAKANLSPLKVNPLLRDFRKQLKDFEYNDGRVKGYVFDLDDFEIRKNGDFRVNGSYKMRMEICDTEQDSAKLAMAFKNTIHGTLIKELRLIGCYRHGLQARVISVASAD